MLTGLLALGLAGGQPGGEAACFATTRDIARGSALSRADIEAVPCKRAARPPLRYDAASGGPIASAPLPAGTYLGRLAPIAESPVAAGDVLTLRSSAGVVVIERRVTAMQPARSGGRVFVRDEAGDVFAVPFAAGAE